MDILDCPMGPNDAKAATVRDYLKALLRKLWREGDNFSGKRPFVNSGWKHYLYKPLIEAGLVEGKLDEDGYIEKVDTDAADQLILAAIERL